MVYHDWSKMCWLFKNQGFNYFNHLLHRKDVAQNPSHVTITGGDSTLHIRTPKGDLNVALPPGVSFEPGSVTPTSAGDHCEQEVHFRLRINAAQHKGKTSHVSIISEYQIFILFQRVLPLPNGNWNTIVDEWCCHPDPFANKKLLPRAEDCLLGDTFLLLARDGSCEHTLTEAISAVGVEDETLKLYITQVVVERNEGDRRPEDSLSRQVKTAKEMMNNVVNDLEIDPCRKCCLIDTTYNMQNEGSFLLLYVFN
uniref:E3 ubiquitin-protein ligase E3D n=1 Tax=Neogobius melanostomus TaxID=47308 RepID=A0A8C6WJX1_9GOBI